MSVPAQRPPELRFAETQENFPVALRVLPVRFRRPLQAVYDVVRVIDNLGDESPGDRTALLHRFSDDLARVWSTGDPEADVLRRLVPVVRTLGLPSEPFEQLLAANLQDQRIFEYETFDDLMGYCRLSANPIGRLVLTVFGQQDPRLVELSDQVCTALQLIEHWQDVGEDRRRGRVYLPVEDRRAHGVGVRDLDATVTSAPLRRLVAFEVARAHELLDAGAALVGMLHGWARLAVAGYVAGGRAAAAALRRSDFDVLPTAPGPRRRDVFVQGVRLLARSPR
jgi:squalene synthase HpnC